jgi:alpha-1,2-mannosyltransferase
MIPSLRTGPRGGHRLPVWHMRDRKTRVALRALVAVFVLLALVIYAAIAGEMLGHVADDVNRLSLFWGWSRFLHAVSPAVRIYNPHVLYAFEHDVVSAQAVYLPFAYPPSLLLLIWPLALLPPVASLLLWLGANLACYTWACWHRPWGPRIAMAGLVAPSTLAAMYYGQVSLLVAAFVIGGCRLAGRRPILAGVLFGLAAVKPQFGLLIPIALASARQWRSVVAAVTTVALAAIASGIAFGWATWARWPSALTGLSRYIAHNPQLARSDPTLRAVFSVLGVGPVLSNAAQLGAASCVAVAIWFCFRRGFNPLATAALMVGAILTTPYALFYDLPIVSYAVLAVIIERHQSRDPFGTGEFIALILVVALPVLIVFNPVQVPWGGAVLALFFGFILRRIAATNGAATTRTTSSSTTPQPAGGVPGLRRSRAQDASS